MRRVITYGTFDLLHYGHINLLRRAKEQGDYLIVALSTDEFNWEQKQKKSYFSYEDRVIPEESWDQKVTDVDKYHVDVFVMGDDWKGKFDFLKDKCEVVYLPARPRSPRRRSRPTCTPEDAQDAVRQTPGGIFFFPAP